MRLDQTCSASKFEASAAEDIDNVTGNKHNPEGNSDHGAPSPGPYWMRMHRDWRFWVGAILMAAAVAVYVLSGDLAWVPRSH